MFNFKILLRIIITRSIYHIVFTIFIQPLGRIKKYDMYFSNNYMIINSTE